MDEINLVEVERRRDRLLDRFGDTPVWAARVTVPTGEFEDWIDQSRGGYVGSAYALVRRPPERLADLSATMTVDGEERERVLLSLPRGSDRWGVPGGGQEDDESFEETVVREVREEVGIDAEPTALCYLRHDVATADGFDERLHTLRAFFHAEYVSGGIGVQPGEVNGATWFREPPADDRLLPETAVLLSDWED
jgi:ADP-ribose pyrophosphatase YjhB (NUDIX family)